MALFLNGAGISGQQVAGVVDALREANHAGYPDSPATQGLIAGLWSSLSGAGRFISRAGSGILVDMFGFAAASSIACGLQIVVALCTLIYLLVSECSWMTRQGTPVLGGTRSKPSSRDRGEMERYTNHFVTAIHMIIQIVFIEQQPQ